MFLLLVLMVVEKMDQSCMEGSRRYLSQQYYLGLSLRSSTKVQLRHQKVIKCYQEYDQKQYNKLSILLILTSSIPKMKFPFDLQSSPLLTIYKYEIRFHLNTLIAKSNNSSKYRNTQK